jgi:hypothetical protein
MPHPIDGNLKRGRPGRRGNPPPSWCDNRPLRRALTLRHEHVARDVEVDAGVPDLHEDVWWHALRERQDAPLHRGRVFAATPVMGGPLVGQFESARSPGENCFMPGDRIHLMQSLAWGSFPIAASSYATPLGCEAAERGLDEDEEPNAYGVELGELFDALGL